MTAAYDETAFNDPAACLAAIAQRVAQGWMVSEIRLAAGVYRVVFKKTEDGE